MSEKTKKYLWDKCYPNLARSDEPAIINVFNKSRLVTIEKGQIALQAGDYSQDYMFIASGVIRVQLITEAGKVVFLYRVGKGEDCVLTTSCLFSGDPFPAEGITETEVVTFSLPGKDFDKAFVESATFRHFVLSNFSKRLVNVIGRIETFSKAGIECSLAHYLLSLSDSIVEITHREIAAELGTAREVISRHLKHFETLGLVELSRGQIRIVDKLKLKELVPILPTWNQAVKMNSSTEEKAG